LSRAKTSKGHLWSDKVITDIRAAIKTRIEEEFKTSNSDQVSKFILAGISQWLTSADSDGALKAYVWMMSALVHQVRYGSFTTAQSNRIFDDAMDLLRISGVPADHPRLGILYSDLYAAMSQIHHTQGAPWASFWYQQLSFRAANGNKERDKAHQSLAFAIRAIRIGLGDIADRELNFAESNLKNHRERCKARMHRIKIARLSSDWSKFKDLSDDLIGWSSIEQSFLHELQWEKICSESVLSQSPELIKRAIQKSGSHYQPIYVCEGRMRLLSHSSFREHEKLSKLSTLIADTTLGINRLGEPYKALSVIEQSHDEHIPISTRFESIGRMMSRLNLMITFEQELLFLGAAVRWLSRNGHIPMAEVCMKELEYRSARFSNGRCLDSLGCMSDLMERNWYKKSA
jgi:hypothetical protein